jgi:hypothetical protein
MSFRASRILLVGTAITAGAMLVYGWIFERFVADFMPLLILASMIGLIDLWRIIGAATRNARVAIPVAAGVLTLWGLWANLGYAVSPQAYWDQAQARNYVHTEMLLSNLTGHPLNSKVIVQKGLPRRAAPGSLYVGGDCSVMLLAWNTIDLQGLPPREREWSNRTATAFYAAWLNAVGFLRVEEAPDTPICQALTRDR